MFKQISAKRLFYTLCTVAAALLFFAFSPPAETPHDGMLTVTFIDVGQGDGTLIKTPEGKTLLIDGGEYDDYNEKLSRFLSGEKIFELDYILATHYHSDHIGGLCALLEEGRVGTLIVPEYDDTARGRERLLNAANAAGVDVSEISRGDSLDIGCPDLYLSVLHPSKGGFSASDENNNSVVLKVEYCGTAFLLTGDLEADAERELVKGFELEADVLKVGHHGSYTSTSAELLTAVDPTFAVISAGAGNRYGHPHHETLAALYDDDVRIYRTDTDGSITFTVSEKQLEAVTTER